MTGLRILIVDDHEVVRIGFRALLNSQDWVDRCFAATSAEGAVEAAKRWHPHVAIVKDWIGDKSVTQVAPQISSAWPACHVLALETVCTSWHASISDHKIAGWIGRDWDARTILRVVNDANTGRLRPREPIASHDGPTLSQRQLEVLRLIMIGATNREIAEQLSLSTHTIKAHTRGLLRVLGVRNRTEAVLRGRRLGIADPRMPTSA